MPASDPLLITHAQMHGVRMFFATLGSVTCAELSHQSPLLEPKDERIHFKRLPFFFYKQLHAVATSGPLVIAQRPGQDTKGFRTNVGS